MEDALPPSTARRRGFCFWLRRVDGEGGKVLPPPCEVEAGEEVGEALADREGERFSLSCSCCHRSSASSRSRCSRFKRISSSSSSSACLERSSSIDCATHASHTVVTAGDKSRLPSLPLTSTLMLVRSGSMAVRAASRRQVGLAGGAVASGRWVRRRRFQDGKRTRREADRGRVGSKAAPRGGRGELA